MSHEHQEITTAAGEPVAFELPAPTAWPIVLALGICLLAAGVVTNLAFSLLGLILAVAGVRGWVLDLSPARAHVEEPIVEPARRARQIAATAYKIEHLRPGVAGHRMQLPEKVHPYRAGVLGGLAAIGPLPLRVVSRVNRPGWYSPS